MQVQNLIEVLGQYFPDQDTIKAFRMFDPKIHAAEDNEVNFDGTADLQLLWQQYGRILPAAERDVLDKEWDEFRFKMMETLPYSSLSKVHVQKGGLRGQAADAYHEFDPKDGTDYDALKTAILTRYQLNAGSY